jgi:hypothetical protein
MKESKVVRMDDGHGLVRRQVDQLCGYISRDEKDHHGHIS